MLIISFILFFTFGVLATYDNYIHQGQKTEGKCYDRFSNEIIGQVCKIEYSSDFKIYLFTSFLITLIILSFYVLSDIGDTYNTNFFGVEF